MSDTTKGRDETPDQDAVEPAAADDVKARFKEALDRKNAAHHASASSAVNTGAVHGSENQGPARRDFRRKSG
ncbi:DUF5302 domain-containing protein [Luteimicrobium subarcticum]|uniref:DUF5302 domain-containing protein n=1 Tax=Luteimicrobium subarcticum TaxID=620910 RepID=A0A2M8WTY2_9MICO|nr:DUF5302 domain-containing protein [Luteimicrobium subarcticum]PJI94359.1 hypothetical protein CLV34_0195 [Luteimicrobium subarcticum]